MNQIEKLRRGEPVRLPPSACSAGVLRARVYVDSASIEVLVTLKPRALAGRVTLRPALLRKLLAAMGKGK